MNIQPIRFVQKGFTIEGFRELLAPHITIEDMTQSVNDVNEGLEDYPEDCGFGSSDFTYSLKEYIDNLIYVSGQELKTVFSPRLSVVKK